MIHLGLGAFAALLVVRSAYLQLWKGPELSARATRQYFSVDTIPAARGDILDAEGRLLVQGTERLGIGIAPREVRDTDKDALKKALVSLGVSSQLRTRAMSSAQRWVELPRPFQASQVSDIRKMRGVYVDPVVARIPFASPGANAFLGSIDPDGNPRGGLELTLDSILAGKPGLQRKTRDPAGKREREVPVKIITPAVRGHTVTLSINKGLQEISEAALKDAVTERNAEGGEIVIIEPMSGEVLAMASYSSSLGFATTSAITSPYEPGSSLKPLLASRLLELQRARITDTVTTGRTLAIPGRRTPITDDHDTTSLSLAGVIKHSSNIGMVKFSDLLSAQEQFEAYRDFGLGMPTGIDLVGEAAGLLNAPNASAVSKSSTAIGYELMVTTLQLAMAYGSIANGGELLEPALVKEVRAADGKVVYRHRPRVVRRTMSPSVAKEMRAVLREVVVGGTASSANITLGELAGKTGTARRAGPSGYSGKYTATFAGMFPADKPQFVIVVALNNPVGMYGGSTAAPVTSAVLRAAATAQNAALDRRTLSSSATPAQTVVAAASHPEELDGRAAVEPEARIVELGDTEEEVEGASRPRAVPDISGLPLRSAVLKLHRAGFSVRLKGAPAGTHALGSTPSAGSIRKPGELVVVHGRL